MSCRKQTICSGTVFSLACASCANMISEIRRKSIDMNETKKFIDLREKFSEKLEPAAQKTEETCWNFYTDSNEKNMKLYQEAQETYSKLFQDRQTFNNFLSINKELLPKHEQKQLKDLLKIFDEELNTGEEVKALRDKENEIAQKYNSYVPMLDGKEVTKTELTKITQTETNPEIRRKGYEAKIKGGDLIADDLIDFIKMRNNFAKSKGYDNYFEYKLKEDYDVDSALLNSLVNEVYSSAKAKIKTIQERKYKELKEFFNISELKPYHYGLLLDSNPDKAVNEILSLHNIEEISKKTYAGMGYNVDKMIADGKLTLDLYPRKGKNTHGFCFGVKAGEDSRILANLTNNVISLDTLNHEMGHCIYDLGLDKNLPFIDREPASSATTEAIAMMMGDIMKLENILADIVPKEKLNKFKDSLKEDESNFVSRSLLIIEFERELYKNPNQNPKELWSRLTEKYMNRKEEPSNEWATIPHYLSHPAYYQNYFRATLMKAQIYNHLKSVLGNITENKNTAEYMDKNIFSIGASIDEYELIKKLTGKEFSAQDFINNL